MKRTPDRGTRLYELLLRAYPRAHRAQYGREMTEVFADLWSEVKASGGAWPKLRFWSSCLVDLLNNVPRAWASHGRTQPEPRPRTPDTRPRSTPFAWLRDIGPDARVGIRAFARRPASSLSAVAALALGIGGVTAIFSVVEGMLLRPLPYAESDRLVRIWTNVMNPQTGEGTPHSQVTSALYHAWRADSRTLDGLVAFTWDQIPIGREDEFPVSGVYGSVTWDFFSFLGVDAVLGRTFDADDEPQGPRAEVAVLSHAFWRQSFGADPDVLGHDVVIGGVPHRVVGVLPSDFHWYEADEEPLVWIPRYMPPAEQRWGRQYVLGRLHVGVTVEALREELATNGETVAWSSLMGFGFQRDDPTEWITASPYREALLSMRRGVPSGDVRPGILLMLGASAFLLLLACINVANILLASTVARRRELAVRSSIGASRVRLVRQLLTEALVLSAMGYLLGLALAWGGVEALKLLAPPDVPRMVEVRLNGTVLAVSAFLSIASGLFFGVVPALGSPGSRLGSALSQGGRSTPSGLRRDPLVAGLVTAQVAASLVMLAAASSMVHSFAKLFLQDVGFEERGLWAAQLRMPPQAPYREDLGIPLNEGTTTTWVVRTGWKTLPDRLVERLAGDPRVAEATTAIGLPLAAGGIGPSWEPAFEANVNYVDPGFFEVLRIPVKAGRSFNADDARSGAPLVAMVNDVLAERFWPGEEVVGKRFPRGRSSLAAPGGYELRDVEIVGVSSRIQEVQLGGPPWPSVYLPRSQLPDTVAGGSWYPWLVLFVRPAQGAESEVGRAIADAVRTVAPDVALNRVRPMSDMVDRWVRTPRFYAFLFASFSVVGLLLTAVGIGGVVAHTVGTGRREIAIRLVLGARPDVVIHSLVSRVLVLTSTGIVIGLLGALALGRFVASQLEQVQPTDPLTLAAVCAFVLVMATVSARLPTRRISRADPLEALKAE